ncbi:hypothetical protein DUI87_05066 [Hirundo rustica rustica]|uniref:Uncharacterized protein n=1 Tax=Hirundo rustica rustica TaxID=333673 RepID=A0A3M0KYE6_HIRRU|nr:hypothetical protein DUI87_05066 [Hirundo rustica rustica]
MGCPETRQDRTTSLPWMMGYAAARQPQVTCRRFTEGTINHHLLLEQLGAQAESSEPVAWAKEQECEDTLGQGLSEEEEPEDSLDAEVFNKEKWEDAIGTEIGQGTDDTGSSPVHNQVNSLGMDDNKGSHIGPKEGPSFPTGASGTPERSQDKEHPSNENNGKNSTAIVTPVAQEEPSLLGKEAAAGPDPSQALTYTIPFSTFLDALAEGSQMWHRKALSILQKALIAAQGKGGQKSQHPTGCKEVLPEPAPSIRAESLDKEHPVKEGPGQQLVEAEPDPELSMKEATEAGTPAGPAFRFLSPTVIDALAQERRTSVFKSVPRALPRAFTAMHRRGEQEQQQSRACSWDLPDTEQYSSSEVLRKATVVIQGLRQSEEQEHSRDATLAVRARVAGAVSPAHGPHSPTADGLALLDTAPYMRDELLSEAVIVIQGSEEHIEEQGDLKQGIAEGRRVTAPAEGTESPGHTVHTRTADAPVFLEYNNYIQTEVVKKAVCMVQKPFKYPEEENDERNAEGLTMAERLAGPAQSLPASTVISTPPRERRMRLVQRVVRALPLASRATSGTGKKEKKHSTADVTDLLNTAEYIRRDVPDKATLEIQGPSQQIAEQQDMEPSRDVLPTVTSTAAGTKSHVHETHHPTADVPVFLKAADYIHTQVIKKAVLAEQRPLQEPEELSEQEQSADEEMRAKARAAEAGRQTHVLHSPRTHGWMLLDTAQYMPAPAKGTESPGHTMHSHTADAPVFLEYNNCIQTEVVKKAVCMVQKPFEYPEEEWEPSAEGSTMAETLAEHAQSLPVSTIINTPACVNTPAGEQQDMEHSREVSPTITPTTAGTKSHVHETHYPKTDALVFVDYKYFLRTESVKKAVLMVQKTFEYQEPQEQERSIDKARAAETESLAHAPHSPSVHDPPLLQTAEYGMSRFSLLPVSSFVRF